MLQKELLKQNNVSILFIAESNTTTMKTTIKFFIVQRATTVEMGVMG